MNSIRKLLDTSAETLANARQVVVNCSSPALDRQGDVIVQSGIDTRSFMAAGGTVLWQHDPNEPIARAIECSVVDGKLRARAQFPSPGVSAVADKIYGLIRDRVVNAASIGFHPIESEPLDPKSPYAGRRFLKVELMEFSFVSIPAAPEATIIARSAFAKSGRVLSGANAALLAALQARLGKGEKCEAKALALIEKARAHHAFAADHASAIAASAMGDGAPDVDDDDPDDPESDVELAAPVGLLKRLSRRGGGSRNDDDALERMACEQRQREVEVLGLAFEPLSDEEAEEELAYARRSREVVLLALSAV